MAPTKRVRLCLKDLYHQDVVEMIERETRKYALFSIEDPSHPDFKAAFDLLWETFGESGEMEREEVIRQFLLHPPYERTKDGTYFRYFLLVAKDKDGNIRGARDGTVLINPDYAPDLCVVYLSHIVMVPEARGTVLSYWLRIAPMEVAMQFVADLAALGKIKPPLPDQPGKNFGMRVNFAAEMEYWSPEEKISLQRILFYGRGGFDAINPRHFPYRQPDFRDPELIRQTGYHPVPFMLLLRRIGRERQATLPIDEARAVMNLLYDAFESHCPEELLENSLQVVLDRLEERAKTKSYVELLPLPTGPKDLGRLKRLFRHNVYRLYYRDEPQTREYVEGEIKRLLKENPQYVDEELAKIARHLEARPAFVYANRAREFTWEGLPTATAASSPPAEDEPDELAESGELPVTPEAPQVHAGPPDREPEAT